MAQKGLNVWDVIRRFERDGHRVEALRTASERRKATPSRLRGAANRLVNTNWVGPISLALHHGWSRRPICGHNGTDRSFRPLPWRRTKQPSIS